MTSPNDQSKTTITSARAIILEALGFHGVLDAEAVADHIIGSLKEEDFNIVKEITHAE